jgi:hypothetical protein
MAKRICGDFPWRKSPFSQRETTTAAGGFSAGSPPELFFAGTGFGWEVMGTVSETQDVVAKAIKNRRGAVIPSRIMTG